MVYSGDWGKLIHEKNRSRKSRDTVPFFNVPLFKKLRDIIFFAGQSLYEPFQGTFWGGEDFFDPLNCPERSTGT